jgi:hypothetical protein
LRHLASAPFIYFMIVPLALLDLFIEIYHRVCFPLYGLTYVKRGEYIRLDRAHLPYLPWYDKINCAYCSYANGLLHYASAIAGETEKYWCGIKHKQEDGFRPPAHHEDFMEYGDEKAFKNVCKLRKTQKR